MFCLSDERNPITCDIFPPVELNKSEDWEIGLVNLCTYNSIPNIEEDINDTLVYGGRTIKIPEGSYEISDIEKYLKSQMKMKDDNMERITLEANNNTLKCVLEANHEIDFTSDSSIGPMLGYDKTVLEANTKHESRKPVTITKINSIRVECNIACGSYINGRESHILHEFFPAVAPGFKIVESPTTVIYAPIKVTDRLQSITVKLVDQNGRLINFRGETITVRLHLRRKSS